MKYGLGYKQQKIIELGIADKLTWGDIVKLYGHSKAFDELLKLETLDLIEKTELKRPSYPSSSPLYKKDEWDAYYNTKIVWKNKKK